MPNENSVRPIGDTVSVVCLAYNQQRFVLQAVRGLLQQSRSQLDMIFLDDASSDATPEIIAAELSRSSRTDVRFIRNERNLGVHGNLFKGISIAKGEFIIISCGDDIMLPNMVEEMVKVWRHENVSLVTANATYIDEDSVDLDRCFKSPEGPYDETFETLARDGSNALCFGAGMGFERQLLEEAGWPRGKSTVWDIMLPFSAYLAKGGRFIPTPLFKYRVNSQNTSVSLAAAATSGVDKLVIESEMFSSHIEQSFLMEAELDRLNEKDPSRYSEIVRRIKPLVAVQTIEMARKLVNTRMRIKESGGDTRPIGAKMSD